VLREIEHELMDGGPDPLPLVGREQAAERSSEFLDKLPTGAGLQSLGIELALESRFW
jgi:hypothetical protein